jgi:ribosomal-protein-serine acetyltransferase
MVVLHVDEEIRLQTLEIEDAEILFRLVDANRLYLREWLPWVDANTTIEESKAFITSAKEQQELNLGFQCGIWNRDHLAGVIGFHRIDWMNKNAEVGYWLGASFQGNGIITKSCRSLIDYAFHVLELHRVQLRCATENKKSRSVIERLGFIEGGITRETEFLYDHYVDLCIFGMIAPEWKKCSNSPNHREP